MVQKRLIVLLLAAAALAGCNAVPPTMVVMQITNTPDARSISVTITNTPDVKAASTLPAAPTNPPAAATQAATAQNTAPSVATLPNAVTQGALPTQAQTAAPIAVTVSPVNVAQTVAPTPILPSATFGPTATPNVFPTDTRQQIFIAQEDFQGGFMFWLQPTKDIWILLPSTPPKAGDPLTSPTSGEWRVFKDTFVDGEPEIDPTLVPPSANFYQPRRGFGKLWRGDANLKALLGWGTTPEFGLNTSYVYQPGGYVDSSNKWIAGPGTHFLISLGRQTFEFHEPQPGQAFGTWKKVG